MTRSQPGTAEAGFTLLEMVVCLGLLAITTSWLQHAGPLVLRATDVVARAEREDSIRAAQMHLRRALERTVPFFKTEQIGDAELMFDGHSKSVRFVTRSDGRLERGGLIVAEFRPEEVDGILALVTERQPLAGPLNADVEPEAVVLLKPIGGLRVRYYGRPDAEANATWADQWSSRSVLPILIRLDIELPDPAGPKLDAVIVGLPAAFASSSGQ